MHAADVAGPLLIICGAFGSFLDHLQEMTRRGRKGSGIPSGPIAVRLGCLFADYPNLLMMAVSTTMSATAPARAPSSPKPSGKAMRATVAEAMSAAVANGESPSAAAAN